MLKMEMLQSLRARETVFSSSGESDAVRAGSSEAPMKRSVCITP